jgi:hypothetical protein
MRDYESDNSQRLDFSRPPSSCFVSTTDVRSEDSTPLFVVPYPHAVSPKRERRGDPRSSLRRGAAALAYSSTAL